MTSPWPSIVVALLSRFHSSTPDKMPIGPALPPHLAHLAGASSSRSPSPEPRPSGATARSVAPAHDDDDSDDDAFGPALPPHLAAARGKPSSGSGAAPASAGPSRPAPYESPSPPRLPSARQPGPAAGPAMGPSFEDDDESDDDVIGPALPTGDVVEKTAVQESMEREERMRQSREVSFDYSCDGMIELSSWSDRLAAQEAAAGRVDVAPANERPRIDDGPAA